MLLALADADGTAVVTTVIEGVAVAVALASVAVVGIAVAIEAVMDPDMGTSASFATQRTCARSDQLGYNMEQRGGAKRVSQEPNPAYMPITVCVRGVRWPRETAQSIVFPQDVHTAARRKDRARARTPELPCPIRSAFAGLNEAPIALAPMQFF